MQKLAFVLLLVLPLSSFADTYICQVDGTDQTITFGHVSELPDEDGWDYVARYKLTIRTTELPFPDHTEYGIAKTGDVWLRYSSNTSEIDFGMYLDEDEPVQFKYRGEDKTFSNCVFHDFNQI